MEGRTKVTRDILSEEGRFILANVLAEGRFSRQNRFDDIRRICESAITLPFSEYVGFLEAEGYLRRDRETEALEATSEGARVANGDHLPAFAERAVQYFKNRRKARGKDAPAAPSAPAPAASAAAAAPLARAQVSSGGRTSATAGGEIQTSGEIVDARYEKLATIGSGGMGTVYRARQVPLRREVALKEIRELLGFFSDKQKKEIHHRFAEVVQDAASLAHPNIAPLHDVNLDREYPYVVSELCEGGSARRLIAHAEELPVGLVLQVLLQTLHALGAAHTQGVVHRGLKPENLLLDRYGNVKVSDFGFSRLVEADAAVIRQVYVGIGSVAYMAPELFTEPASVGPQADIYALGIIFYELLTRRLPGRRSPMPSQHAEKLPRAIDDIFDKMTRDSRAERYASVDDILDDCDRVEGLGDVLDEKTRVLVAKNPLEAIKFNEPPSPKHSPAVAAKVASPAAGAGAPEPDAEADSAGKPERSAKKQRVGRPYSYQQRQKRT
jgi:serine/threonine protein kinase